MLDYARKLDKKCPKIKFEKLCPKTCPELISILENLLLINPFFRSSASEAIKWKIFNVIRDKKKEQSSNVKLKLDVDSDEAFDYEKCVSKVYDLKAYKKILKKTVDTVH